MFCIWQRRFRYFTCLPLTFIVVYLAGLTNSYKPVIIMHGLFDQASSLNDLAGFITKAHPGTEIHSIDVFDDSSSLKPLQEQLDTIINIIKPIMLSSPQGVHLIGYSQGGLLCRGMAQTMDDHNIINFIALSSPLNGQYGDTAYVNKLFPGWLKEDMYKIFYTSFGQKISIANYWKDPNHAQDYEEYSEFLGPLNNESTLSSFRYPLSWRKNFARLENLVLIGGPDDGVITPWQSSHFACYDSKEKVVTMRNLKIYNDDVFGLKSLDKAGKIHECTMAGVEHVHWHQNETVFLKCIEPWLV